MTQKQAKYITTQAFPEPNYTQTPNDFFDMLPSMEHSEIAVTLVMIRNTFGFHRTSFKMGLGKLADAAGISRNSAKTGAESAEARGTFRRVNPDAQTEAEWELIVGQPLTPFNDCIGDGQPLHTPPSTIDSQSPIKESIKEKKDIIDHLLDMSNFPGAKAEARRNSILSYLGERLHVNTETKAWREFAKYVDGQQQKGEKIETFIAWLLGQDKFQIQYWPPRRMMEMWPQAFVKTDSTNSPYKPLPEDNNVYVPNPNRRTS